MPNTKVTRKKHFVWTELDSWGIPFGVYRLPMESNKDFKARLLAAMKANGDASKQGLIDGLSALFRLKTYNIESTRHFYLNLTPVEYNAAGEVLDITVTIDSTAQTQNLEYYTPKDWMSGGRGNYVFDADAEGYIIWRDSNGKYTNHLEFLTAPPTGTAITIDYWAKIDDTYVHVVETSEENPSLVPKSSETPTGQQITVQQLFDADFLSEHTKSTGVPDESLQKIISDANEHYPFQWGQFVWDKFQWDIDVNEGLLPSYYDGTTQSGDFKSGTGHGNALKIESLTLQGYPNIYPGYLYYSGREYYMYKLMDYQESEFDDYDVTLVNESGDYLDIIRNAPVVVKANLPDNLFVSPTGSLLTGGSQKFQYNPDDPTNTVFTITAGTPYDQDYITIKRYSLADGLGQATNESGWVYLAPTNTISVVDPLPPSGELFVTWPDSTTRYIKSDITETISGPNIVRTHQEGYRTIMDPLVTTQTLDNDLAIITTGDHNHYIKLTDPYEQDGTLESTALAGESGNVAAIMGVHTVFYPDDAGYMELTGKDHAHQISSGVVQTANIKLADGTTLGHTHGITFPTNFGWVEPTPDILPHKPDPKAVTLVSPAAQAYLTSVWDNLSLDADTYQNGSYNLRSESGSLRMDIAGSETPHTIFYERGVYLPDEEYFTLTEAHCPSLYRAQGKILVVGGHIPPVKINVYPERTIISEWDKALGLTIEALDAEGLGGVKDCRLVLTAADDYSIVDMKIDNAVTDIYGTVYFRPIISEGGTAITKGDTFDLTVTGTFIVKDRYKKPLPSTVTETIEGVVGDQTYTYTITKTFSLTWIGD